MIAGLLAFFSSGTDNLSAALGNYLGSELLEAITRLFGADSVTAAVFDWLLGPALPVVVALVIAGAAWSLLRVPVLHRPLIDYLWPSEPDILETTIERAWAPDSSPYAPNLPFLERSGEMQHLLRFAGGSQKASGFIRVTGREGIGKTRLSLEWLRRLRGLKWDVGVLTEDATQIDIRRAGFRRKTAILIDEPAKLPALWQLVDELLQKPQRICVVLADQVVPSPSPGLDTGVLSRLASADAGELVVPPLSSEAISAIAPDLSPAALARAEGRALIALLGDNPDDEVARRARRRLDLLMGHENETNALVMATLAGPFPSSLMRNQSLDNNLLA